MKVEILLREIMQKRKLTTRQLEILSGVSRATIGDIRKGSMPRIDTLLKLAKGLGIDIKDLYKIENDTEN
jgi:transcriptional regulator with XRE-family HTH domain